MKHTRRRSVPRQSSFSSDRAKEEQHSILEEAGEFIKKTAGKEEGTETVQMQSFITFLCTEWVSLTESDPIIRLNLNKNFLHLFIIWASPPPKSPSRTCLTYWKISWMGLSIDGFQSIPREIQRRKTWQPCWIN